MPKRKFSYVPKLESVAKVARATAGAARVVTRLLRQDRKEGPSDAITQQHDSKLLYKRKRAPKSKRRKARRKFLSHLRLELQNAANNDNLFQVNNTGFSTTAGLQNVLTITSGYMAAGSGVVSDQVGSWRRAMQNYLNAHPDEVSYDMYITGLSTDYTLVNISANTMELDVYEYILRGCIKQYFGASGIKSMFLDTEANESKLAGATSKMSLTDLGWTPFDSNDALKFVIIKSKQRYYISAGQAISFTKDVKFRKPIKVNSIDFQNTDESSSDFSPLAYVTRGIMCVFKGLPNATDAASAVNLAYNAQAKYRFKVLQHSSNANAIGD